MSLLAQGDTQSYDDGSTSRKNAIGVVLMGDSSGSSGGAALQLRATRPTNNWRQLASTADQNPNLISASAKALHYVRGQNATAGVKYLKIYDKATRARARTRR